MEKTFLIHNNAMVKENSFIYFFPPSTLRMDQLLLKTRNERINKDKNVHVLPQLGHFTKEQNKSNF